ncbi:hypothetical protein PR048_017827 [Dryococelus australis]|uniref:Uncharacterized protein n=1 Tax=Dryococelus australis TaxID=614101 RepID=A0ABQ9HAV8_9NEOP|nr:hypothetical protein PR048_017827 [Dryococelus australis]
MTKGGGGVAGECGGSRAAAKVFSEWLGLSLQLAVATASSAEDPRLPRQVILRTTGSLPDSPEVLPLLADVAPLYRCPRSFLELMRLLASQLSEPCSIPGGVAPGFLHVGIVPDDAAVSVRFDSQNVEIPRINYNFTLRSDRTQVGFLISQPGDNYGLHDYRLPCRATGRSRRRSSVCCFRCAYFREAPCEHRVRPRDANLGRSMLLQTRLPIVYQGFFTLFESNVFENTSYVGRGGWAVSLLASHQFEPGSSPGRVTPKFSHVGIVLDDAAGWRVFSGSPVSSVISFRRCSILTSITLTSSQDITVKSPKSLNLIYTTVKIAWLTMMEKIVKMPARLSVPGKGNVSQQKRKAPEVSVKFGDELAFSAGCNCFSDKRWVSRGWYGLQSVSRRGAVQLLLPRVHSIVLGVVVLLEMRDTLET